MTDSEIVRAVLDGDTECFADLVTRYSARVYRLCREQGCSHHAAEDATQEAFVEAYLHLASLHTPESFYPWLSSIARKKCFRQFARGHGWEELGELSEILSSDNDDPAKLYFYSERRRCVCRAIDLLPEGQREVMKRFYLDGQSIRTIADELDLPQGTVKRRLHDARERLRGDLMEWNETNTNELERKIMEQVKQLERYYSLHCGEKTYESDYRRLIESTVELAGKLHDDKTKQNLMAEALLRKSYLEKSNELRDEARAAAIAGDNAEVLGRILVNELFDSKNRLEYLDNIGFPALDALSASAERETARGILYFWRGRNLLGKGNDTEAYDDFVRATELIEKSDVYYANAVAAVRSIELMRENAYALRGIYAMGEGVIVDGSRVIFHNEPGFSVNFRARYDLHAYDAHFYYATLCQRIFYDLSMKPGDTVVDEKQNARLTLMATDETVQVAAGRFDGCMHMKTEGNYTYDVWYAPGVGIVKIAFRDDRRSGCYELTEYKVVGGGGYMPMAVGNRWVYKNPAVPEGFYQHLERSVEYTDGVLTNYAVINLFSFSKTYRENIAEDSILALAAADDACGEWKLDDAALFLKAAVRANSSQNEMQLARFGLPTIERFAEWKKKDYRFCPSYVSGSYLTVTSGKSTYQENGFAYFGPYRLGKRGRIEDRIFGSKPLRYQQELLNGVWDDAWVVGYREEKEYEDAHVTVCVTDGGTVETPAGTFEGCRLLTIEAEVPGETNEKYYFAKRYSHMYCGTKRYWYAPGVGIVREVCDFGPLCHSEIVLVEYSAPAARTDEFFPVQVGNRWEYDEVNLSAEGYRARCRMEVLCGIDGKYLLGHAQEFVYLDTEENYNKLLK